MNQAKYIYHQFWLFLFIIGCLVAALLAADFRMPPAGSAVVGLLVFHGRQHDPRSMTADLEAMKQAGISGGIFLRVNLGIPRGPVELISQPWQDLLKYAASESNCLGLQLTLGTQSASKPPRIWVET